MVNPMKVVIEVLSFVVLSAVVISKETLVEGGGCIIPSQAEPISPVDPRSGSNQTAIVQKTIIDLDPHLKSYKRGVNELGKEKYGKLESGSLFYKDGIHGFIMAIHQAFKNHLELQISPDHIWTLLMFSIGDHINADPEKYREALGVRHEGKRDIRIIHDGLTRFAKPDVWAEVFPLFESQLRNQTASGAGSKLTLQFTTTTALDRIIRSIALMGALKSYYNYVVGTRCGIRRMIILGSVKDWNLILEALKGLPEELGLSDWTNKVIPHIQKFINAIGNPATSDLEFWRSIYKYDSLSGGFEITGWILDFFPNVKVKYVSDWIDFKTGYTAVPFVWNYLGETFPMDFVAGFTKHEVANNTVIPQMAWGVYHQAEENRSFVESNADSVQLAQ